MTAHREVSVRGGYTALVDESDYELVASRRWHLNMEGYVVSRPSSEQEIESYGREVKLHRLITGAASGQPVDHVSGDKMDNRRSNLRLCTVRQNCANRRKRKHSLSARPGSPYRGVSWRAESPGKPWQARIGGYSNERRYLGAFATQEEAARVYDDAARKLFGEFAALNFPEPGEQSAVVLV